jgi:imidazolonepropionase-like amidohydrolase
MKGTIKVIRAQGSAIPLVLSLIAGLCASANASAQELLFGPAMEGAWHNPDLPGQGLLVDSSPGGDFFFAGWFTYQAQGEESPGKQRWWTIEGAYEDDSSALVIYHTTGGEFLGDFPVMSTPAGTARVSFPDCDTLVLEYDFDAGPGGEVTLERLLPVPEGYCDSQTVVRDFEDIIEADTPVVFRNVSLVTMSEGAPLVSPSPSSVLVENGVISGVGDFGAFGVPSNAIIVDGRGRFLMPGLVDSHTHLAVNVIELQGFASPATLELVSTNQLQLYLLNGVTTILNLGDFGEPQTRWADEIENGSRIGPTLITAKYARGNTSSCDGGPSQVVVGSTFEAGQAYVQEAIEEGYRLIKIYNCTPPDAVDGILAEAAAQGISVAGHLPNQYDTPSLLLDPTFSLVAHSNAFLWNGYLNLGSSPGQRGQAVTTMLNGGTSLSSTLWIAEKIAQVWCRNQPGIDALLAESPIEYMHSTELDLHERSVTSNRFAPAGCNPGGFNGDLLFARDMVRRVLNAGGIVFAGTDSPTVLGAAGFSMHSELQALRNAGLTDQQALAAATANAGIYLSGVLPEETPIGRIESGHRADLLLLDRPPAAAIDDFAESLEMVIARGTVYPRAVREAWLERIREEYDITCPPYCRP